MTTPKTFTFTRTPMKIVKRLLYILIPLIFESLAFPWCDAGHETILAVAKRHLTASTQEKLKPFLDGDSLESLSLWAEKRKTTDKTTIPWHYIDIPVREKIVLKDFYDFFSSKTNAEPNLIKQLEIESEILKDLHAPFERRKYSLCYLVHLMGDLHDPLNCADDNDRHGKDKAVQYTGPKTAKPRIQMTTLKDLWDNLIEVKAQENPQTYAFKLSSKFTSEDRIKWQYGSFEEWAYESFCIAKKDIYTRLPAGAAELKLTTKYYDKMRPLVDLQIEKAGVRLAFLLEQIFWSLPMPSRASETSPDPTSKKGKSKGETTIKAGTNIPPSWKK